MSKMVTFHDYQPEALSLKDAVLEGLSLRQKTIPPKFFYDERGSKLFDEICLQPEYYPPTVELEMLKQHVAEIAQLTGQGRTLIEPGAGSAVKVQILLDHLKPAAFIPMDISFDHLKSASLALAQQYQWLPIHAACVDFSHSLPIPQEAPEGNRLLFFPGSSIGNFDHKEAQQFLRMIHDALGQGGMVLIGVDTKKNEQVLNAAYNDKAGVTAEFNLNLLYRMRNELGMDLNPDDFEHSAFYNAKEGRIEMHLVSKKKQLLVLNGHQFNFSAGETLHTENSYKYTPEEFLNLAASSGFKEVSHWVDKEALFAIYLLAVI
mgnify:CR=1 FL=1